MLEKIAKTDFKLESISNVELDFDGMKIEVIPYFSVQNKTIIFKNYLETLYNGILSKDNDTLADHYIQAEYGLRLAVIDLLTNIDISFDSATFDAIFAPEGLWDEICDNIPYDEMRYELSELISVVEQKDKLVESVGAIIHELAQKIIDFANSLPKDLNAEQIQTSLGNFTEQLNQLNQKVPGILNAPGAKTTKKPKKDIVL